MHIETISNRLKNISQLERSRHRSATNFMANVLSALIAYHHQPKKPALRFEGFEPSQQPFQPVGSLRAGVDLHGDDLAYGQRMGLL